MLIDAANLPQIARDARKAEQLIALQDHSRLEPVEEAGIACTRFAQAAKGSRIDMRH